MTSGTYPWSFVTQIFLIVLASAKFPAYNIENPVISLER
jgi:hypothetical protein